MTTPEWDQLVERRRNSRDSALLRRDVRRSMWGELGFTWSNMGLFGDICFGMGSLTESESAAFDAELDRRVEMAER